jgi:S-DNA-T family DNA segregation ATPase FtsK/SpoIIIE
MNNASKQDTDSKILQRTLDAHGVRALHVRTFTGPTVTQHAFDLSSGTPLKRVTALHQDLALALGLDSVRIIAPIPGTAWVGIEVPNEDREDVTYADFVHDAADVIGVTGDQVQQTGILPIPVGVTITSEALWADLTKLPHLIIAGTTGSGKSVALTSAIAHLIATKSPAELRLWLVDPKRVELQQFADAPQVQQVATSPADALDLLDDVVAIMDERYKLFESLSVRNIGEYNQQAYETEGAAYLPYHVVVVDELADLMMTGNKRIEETIVRLAQLARAAGIHLILATQRPTRDVVTGLISANITSRWCFRVGSHIDSNVALGTSGAEALYGHGDSLWSPAGSLKPIRVQGVYTPDETVESIVTNAVHEHTAEPLPSAAADDDDEFDEELPDTTEVDLTQPIFASPDVNDGRWFNMGHIDETTDAPAPTEGYVVAEPVVLPEPMVFTEEEKLNARIANAVAEALAAQREDQAARRSRFGWLKSKWLTIPAIALGGSWTIGACLQLLGYGS